jgi:hypothetical protein
MKTQSLDRLIGQHCKIVMKEPGDTKAHTVVGIIQEIDQHAGFLIVKSTNGFWCLNLNEILAIKPKKLMKNT